MFRLMMGSLFVGSLGVQALLGGGWLYRWQYLLSKRFEEEELLTPYETPQDSSEVQPWQISEPGSNGAASARPEEWEYKIVRANSDLFRDAEVFAQLCEEEAEAGWMLLEKLDDRRVRFKRPISARIGVKTDPFAIDPYRCHYGPTMTPLTWLGAIALIASMLLPAYLGYTLVSEFVMRMRQSSPQERPTLEPLVPNSGERSP
ncbi:MAG: hypothetical protein F6K32_04010 [Desertifilum sp. SIO1I2]|nr:hypothetical protein [Desertifilum sp. SIO1I2]